MNSWGLMCMPHWAPAIDNAKVNTPDEMSSTPNRAVGLVHKTPGAPMRKSTRGRDTALSCKRRFDFYAPEFGDVHRADGVDTVANEDLKDAERSALVDAEAPIDADDIGPPQ